MASIKDISEKQDHRRNPRIETSNLVDYTLFDNDGKTIGQGKGRTLNLSQNGILLKTPRPLDGVFVMLMAIDLNGNTVKVEGRLVYSTMDMPSGYFLSGIEFTGPKEKQVDAIVAFVKAYNHSKHKGNGHSL